MKKAKVKTAVTNYDGVVIKENQATLTRKLIDGIRKTNITSEQVCEILEKEITKDDLTYRTLIYTALNSILKDEVLTATNKAKCYEITAKTFASNEPEYTNDQVNFIIERAEKIFDFPLHIGKLKDFLTTSKAKK